MSRIVFCTVITQNYMRYAKVLYQSLQNTQVDFQFYALVIDGDLEQNIPPQSAFEFETIFLDELEISNINDMKIYYDAFELCNAARPSFVKHLMEYKSAEKVVYLDADIVVTGKFDKVDRLLDEHLFCFTPHVIKPMPLDGKLPDDVLINDSGVFNSGFWAFKKSEKSMEILDWMISRLEIYCFNDISNKMFVDQKLLPMLTVLFKNHFYCLDDPGYNVAYWNLHERNLVYKNDLFYANDEPVVFFHLSGFDEKKPDILTKFQHRVTLQDSPVFQMVIKKFMDYLSKVGLPEVSLPYRFATIGGIGLTQTARRYYFQKRNFNGLNFYKFKSNISKILCRMKQMVDTI